MSKGRKPYDPQRVVDQIDAVLAEHTWEPGQTGPLPPVPPECHPPDAVELGTPSATPEAVPDVGVEIALRRLATVRAVMRRIRPPWRRPDVY